MMPQQYLPVQYYYDPQSQLVYVPVQYTPAQYQALQLEGLIDLVLPIVVVIALAAWGLSLLRDLFTGKEVKFPL